MSYKSRFGSLARESVKEEPDEGEEQAEGQSQLVPMEQVQEEGEDLHAPPPAVQKLQVRQNSAQCVLIAANLTVGYPCMHLKPMLRCRGLCHVEMLGDCSGGQQSQH